MIETNNTQRKTFSDFLSILFKWKKFLIINLFFVTVISVTIVLLIDNQYKSNATVIISSSSEGGLPLSGMLSDVSSLLGVGGMNSGDVEYLLGILGSRQLRLKLIDKFDLIDYYEFTKYKLDKTLKRMEDDYFYELNDNGMIDISFIHKSPQISAEIVKYIIHYADSVNLSINQYKAKNYRQFIEKRYDKCLRDLSNAELDLKNFQEKTDLYVIPEQLLVSIQGLIDFEKQLYTKQLELEILKVNENPNSSRVNLLEREIKVLKNNLEDIKAGKGDKTSSTAFIPTKNLPKIYADYVRIYRKIEIQNRILEILTPLYEQALMDEQKKMPTLITLDNPIVPELKYSPKRSAIVIIVLLLSLFFIVPITVYGEYSLTTEPRNLFEVKSNKFFKRLSKIYFLKL